ncbi:hypothetical protein [Nocardia sp. bgisy134]|uniref:hypothetical protein n=1 Tax=unclassified Nocardia TaxID=2637762 RepID=UPI003D750DC1
MSESSAPWEQAEPALSIAHTGDVLRGGQIVLRGSAEELLDNVAVRDAYLGKVTA